MNEKDDVSLVVGGSCGLGACLAEAWDRQGYTTVVACRSEMVRARETSRIRCVTVDLEDADWIDRLLASEVMTTHRIRRLAFAQRYRGQSGELWNRWRVEIDAVRDLCLRLQRDSLFAEDAAVVCVSSVASKQFTSSQCLGYHQVKAGLEQSVRFLAVVLGRSKVRINCVRPTRFVKDSSAAYYEANEAVAAAYRKSPLGRLVLAEEVADVMDFLCGAKSRCITGSIIPVDCGFGLIYGEDLLLDE